MTIDFLIGAIRASQDLHPQVKTELEEILHSGAFLQVTEQAAIDALRDAGWTECDYNCEPFALVKAKIGKLEKCGKMMERSNA